MSETLNLMFGGFLGQTASTVSVRAKAVYALPPGCIVTLDKTAAPGINVDGSAKLQAPSCSVWSNATSSTSSVVVASAASITAAKVCAAGGGSGTVMPTLERHCQSSPDPFAGRSLSASTGCSPTPAMPVKASTTLLPGVYCGGLAVQGNVTVTFAPGEYTILGGALHFQGGPTITGSGVSILLGSGAYLDFQGTLNISLTAMTSGRLAGLVFASDPSAPAQTSTLKGNVGLLLAADVSGSIYLPNHTLSVGGSSDLILKGAQDRLVVGSLSVSGSSRVASSASFPTTPSLTLVQ
jgi:hypothetical protein